MSTCAAEPLVKSVVSVAFIVTPYLAYRLLKGHVAAAAHPHDRVHEDEEDSRFARFYRRLMTPLMTRPRRRLAFDGATYLVHLAVVLSLARQSADDSQDLEDFRGRFVGRIRAVPAGRHHKDQRSGIHQRRIFRQGRRVSPSERATGRAQAGRPR